MIFRPASLRLLYCAVVPAMLLLGAGATASASQPDQHAAAGVQPGDDPHAQHRAMAADAQARQDAPAAVKLHERTLLTQDGKSVRFPQDVISDRIVVMDFVYTTCTTVCPILSAILRQVQNSLGQRLGAEVVLVSISVDPGRDTPGRLKAYAASHHAQPGWTWLTGDKTSVDMVLNGLGAYTPNFEDHPSMVLVGDARSGQWKRFFGFPGPNQILAAVDELLAAKEQAGAAVSRQ